MKQIRTLAILIVIIAALLSSVSYAQEEEITLERVAERLETLYTLFVNLNKRVEVIESVQWNDGCVFHGSSEWRIHTP